RLIGDGHRRRTLLDSVLSPPAFAHFRATTVSEGGRNMRFDWTAEDVRIHEHFREAGRTLLGASHGVTPESPVRRQDWERLGNCGMLGLCVPKDFGGWSLNALQTAHAIEGFALTCLNNGITFSACAHLL